MGAAASRMDQLTRPLRSLARRGGPRDGFTLLEVVIALGILAFGLLAMLAMQMQALRGGNAGRHQTRAAQIARDRMEIFQRSPWITIPDTGGWVLNADVTQIEGAVTGGAAPVSTEAAFNVDWRVTDMLPNLRQIDVRVTWSEPSDPPGWPPRRYALTSQRYGP